MFGVLKVAWQCPILRLGKEKQYSERPHLTCSALLLIYICPPSVDQKRAQRKRYKECESVWSPRRQTERNTRVLCFSTMERDTHSDWMSQHHGQSIKKEEGWGFIKKLQFKQVKKKGSFPSNEEQQVMIIFITDELPFHFLESPFNCFVCEMLVCLRLK